ncbi:MAG: extracellular solute-binding protein, partial [Actinomycetota bacterium]|nr:extracellular solute-binding protein [Actinomycetota bacterium]
MNESDAVRRDASVRASGVTRRRFIERGAAGATGVLGASVLAACGSSSSSKSAGGSGGSITIGSFQDNAMAPFRDTFIKRFAKETGIQVKYNETAYDAWYQNAKNDGLNKTGAYDIYVMDDNWVAEFAAGKIIQNLDQIGFKANPDILAKGLEQGYWPPKSGARLKAFQNAT